MPGRLFSAVCCLRQGVCSDRSRVSGEFRYQRAVFSSDACQQVARLLKKVRDHVHDDFALYAYEAQLSRYVIDTVLCCVVMYLL